ncbi:MAG: cadherin-like beta sandwich domain-containing protein, partial [Marinisporobacter sp.]|nr:cadherin-like beta sandwich domain-containing protein [Marinisporobacter sp.]
YISFEVTPVASSGTSPGSAVESSVTGKVVAADAAPVASCVSISGTVQVGQTLTGSYTYNDVNGDTEGTSTFKWYRSDDASGTNKTEISGAISKTYELKNTELEKYISFEVTPVASSGISPGSAVESSATGGVVAAEAAPVASSVSISGTAQVGETLTGSYTYSDVNGDTEGTSTFKWYRSDDASETNKTEISGATNKTYTLTSTDLGKYISFEVTPVAQSGTSPGSAVESSATGGVIAAEAAPVASSVSISGTAQVGETLTGSYTYSDVNGDTEGTSTFKWYRSDDVSGTNKTEISGAVSKTYKLTSTDLGKYISFEVIPVASSGTSPGSAVESSATGGVIAAEAAPVASSVSISGTAQVGQTLTGSYTYSDVNGDTEGTSTFKWYRSDDASGTNKTEISGATNKTYILTSTDLGKYISFEVTPVAQSGTSPGSAVESSATGEVVAAPTYSITAIGNKTMNEKIEGYVSGSQETKDITITKSGTGNLVNLSVALSGTNANSFEITQPVATTLDDSKISTSFTVKAKDGLAEGTYTATVTVSANNMNDVTFNVTQVVAAKPLSTDCDVTAITKPSGVTKNGTNITANVAYTTTSSIVDVSVSNDATWKLYSDANCNNEITNKRMNLNVGDNTAYIKVIAENGTTTKTYKIEIKRSVAPDSSAPYIIGTNPTNNTVNVEVYKKIEITFSEKIYIGSKIDLMTLKKGNTVVEHVYGIDDNKLTVNPKIDLDYGTFYTLTIPEQTVTDAVYNSLEDEYVLNFTTEKILSSNADLSRINLSNVSLTPAFNPDQTKYTAGVGYSVNTITITPTKDDNHTKISVNGKEVTSGQASESINLNVGSNTITIVVTAEDQTTKTYTIEVTREAKKDSGSSSSGGSSSSTTPSESESQTGSKVIVNGEEETAGKETIKEENGEKNVELVVNSEILNKKIEEATMKEETNNLVEVAVETKDADRVETVLTGDIVKKMDEKEFKLSIKTDEIDYIIPAKEVGIDQVSEILGVKMDSLKDIKVEVQIEKLDSKIVKEIEEKAKAQDYEVVFPPVEFKVVAKTTDTSGEVKSTEISKFSSYVERVMEIPEGVDPSKITTGIVYNADGTFSHIPTEVFKKGDKWFAKLNSLTNSSYSVIWNPITVESVENHWSKEYVNDLASRLVIKNPESFKPDESITRGEFAEYITKAIGVYRTKVAKSGQFTDVEVNNELADAITIAVDYGIIKGYPDGTFRPDGKINREEAMTMYAKAMDIVKLREVDHDRIESYKDKNQVSPWAYDFVKKTISANVFNGRTKETIAPQGTFTYAEAAAAIENLLIESGLINK